MIGTQDGWISPCPFFGTAPHALQFALAKHPDWSPAAVEAAMEPGPMKIARLKAPIPVVLFYSTAIIDQRDKALFAPDIYKRDPALELALSGRHGKERQPINR